VAALLPVQQNGILQQPAPSCSPQHIPFYSRFPLTAKVELFFDSASEEKMDGLILKWRKLEKAKGKNSSQKNAGDLQECSQDPQAQFEKVFTRVDGNLTRLKTELIYQMMIWGRSCQALDLSDVEFRSHEFRTLAFLCPTLQRLNLEESFFGPFFRWKEQQNTDIQTNQEKKQGQRKDYWPYVHNFYWCFQSFHNLQALNLSGCDFVTDVMSPIFSSIKTLKELHLARCYSLTDEGVKCLSNCSSLTYLSLEGCYLLEGDALPYIAQMPWLEKLNMNDCFKLDRGSIAVLCRARALKILGLSRTPVDTELARVFVKLRTIEVLDLRRCIDVDPHDPLLQLARALKIQLLLQGAGPMMSGACQDDEKTPASTTKEDFLEEVIDKLFRFTL